MTDPYLEHKQGQRRRTAPRSTYTKAHAFNKLMSLAEVIDIPMPDGEKKNPVWIEYAERGRWVLCLNKGTPDEVLIHYRSLGPVFNPDGTPNAAAFDHDLYAEEDEAYKGVPNAYPQDYLDDTRYRFLDALKEFGREWAKIAYILISALRENHPEGNGHPKTP